MDVAQIIKIPKIENVSLLDAQLRVDCKGILMTNPHDFRYVSDKREIRILHTAVDSVERDADKGVIRARIRLKTGQILNMLIGSEFELEAFAQSIQLLSMVETRNQFPFDFTASDAYEDLDEVVISSTASWFRSLRQKRWRLMENKQFAICATYGQHVVVPESIRDDIISKGARGRDGARFPVLSCLAGNSHNPLMRSASLGFVETRSTADEELLKRVSNGQKGLIIDVRPAAMIKELRNKKKGLESDYAYPLYRKEYPALPNRYTIHDAFCKCWEAIESKADDFLDKLRKSGWLATVDSILSVSSMAAQGLLQAPILVHGGEGFDVTLTITSLAQIILLPECRTIRGFLGVIQREWLEAGHPFAERYRRGPWCPKSQKTSNDGSTFFLFLHSVNYLCATYPSHFQFNSSLLLTLHDHCSSSQFGTFLGASEKERSQLKVKSKTYSIWKLFQQECYANPLYEAPIPQPAWPLGPCDLWRDYWCRYQGESGTVQYHSDYINVATSLEVAAVQTLVQRNQQLKTQMMELSAKRSALR